MLKQIAILFFTLTCFILSTKPQDSHAQTVSIDGWAVTYLGKDVIGDSTRFSYRACHRSGQGPLKKFTLGVPSCYPDFVVMNTSPTLPINPSDWDDSNGVYGIVFRNLNLSSGCKDFSYTVEGVVANAQVNQITIGLTDHDVGESCTDNKCGSHGFLPGPKCTIGTTFDGTRGCNALYSYGDVVIMRDGSQCVTPKYPEEADDPRLLAQEDASYAFVDAMSELDLGARTGIASYNWGNTSNCNTQLSPLDEFYPWARFSSLTDGYGGYDYDGYLHQEYDPHIYRAIAQTMKWPCGDPSLDAAINVAHRHLLSGRGDNQSPNYMILISHGRTNRWSTNGGGSCTSENSCNCTTAKNYALSAASAAKAQGTKIFTVFLDDSTCSCTSSAINAGKALLRDQIATDSSYYYEATLANISNVLTQIQNRLTVAATCLSGESCVDGCCEGSELHPTPTPTATPTPTPSATPTPTSTPAVGFSCKIGNGNPQLSFNVICNTNTVSINVVATTTGAIDNLVKTWGATCPNSQFTITGDNTAQLKFSIDPTAPTSCDITYLLAKGGKSNSCALKVNVTPSCELNCVNTDLQPVKLAVDTQASNINQMAKRAGNLLTKVAKTLDKKKSKKVLNIVSKNVSAANSLYLNIWNTIWTQVAGFSSACTPTCSTVSLLSQKSTIQSSSTSLISAVNTLLNSVTKNSRDKRILKQAKTIRKKLNGYASEETKAINSIPSSTQRC